MPLIYFPAPPRLGLRSPASPASCTGVRHSPPPRSPCFQLPQFLTKGFHQILPPTPCSPALYPRNQGRSRRSQHGARGVVRRPGTGAGSAPFGVLMTRVKSRPGLALTDGFRRLTAPKGL